MYYRSQALGAQWNSNLRYSGISSSLPATLETWIYLRDSLSSSTDSDLIFFSKAYSLQTVASMSSSHVGCGHKQDLANTFTTFRTAFPSFSQYSGWMHLSCGFEAAKLWLSSNEMWKDEAVTHPTFNIASTTAGYFNVGASTDRFSLKEIRLWNQIRSHGQIMNYLYQ